MIAKKRPACRNCGNGFIPRTPSQKYCDTECAYGAALRKQRGRTRQRDTTAGPVPVDAAQPAQRRVPVLRARTLAETPDVREAAARGDMLTGKAGACCTAGRVIHASGGVE